jgi:RimJ/RimL family protein N-acetyltransferase
MDKPIILQTERLTLRPLSIDDAQAISDLLSNDPETVRMTEGLPFPCTVDAARQWTILRTAPGEHAFVISSTEYSLMGACGFHQDGATAGIGYWLGYRFWGRGYATEVLRTVLSVARSKGVQMTIAEVFADNLRSARVLEKCGFVLRGSVIKEALATRQGPQTVLRYVAALEVPASGTSTAIICR